ncbi:MAG: hypothetical protein HYW48_01825 [Deltaproteobacteria bacterium]|nr:hypothetical protein [Deltaproteobacteria bacterium]
MEEAAAQFPPNHLLAKAAYAATNKRKGPCRIHRLKSHSHRSISSWAT